MHTFRWLAVNQIVVIALGLVASWFDVRSRRIPNLLTFGGAGFALAYGIMTGGSSGLLASVLGWLTGAALFFPFFALGGMGAGDVKLLACLGAWLGPEAALFTGLYAAVAGGVMAVVIGLSTGYLGQAVANTWLLLAHWRVAGIRPLQEVTLEGSRGPRLPYALPIAVGACAVIWLR